MHGFVCSSYLSSRRLGEPQALQLTTQEHAWRERRSCPIDCYSWIHASRHLSTSVSTLTQKNSRGQILPPSHDWGGMHTDFLHLLICWPSVGRPLIDDLYNIHIARIFHDLFDSHGRIDRASELGCGFQHQVPPLLDCRALESIIITSGRRNNVLNLQVCTGVWVAIGRVTND